MDARPPTSARRRGPSPSAAGEVLVAHDLKNLAGRLKLLAQNLAEHFNDPLFKPAAVGALNTAVEHLQQLARDLHDHEGRLLVQLRVNLDAIVRQALEDLRPSFGDGIEVVERYGDPPPVWGDAFLLRRAFACAIENAVDAMSGGGRLTIVTSAGRAPRSRRVVEIADTGRGMSPEFVREQLFRPFSSTKETGLGLGAYTIRQVAALHGASVRVISAEGVGTRVRVCFPAD